MYEDANGDAVVHERYQYGDYGNVTYLDASGTRYAAAGTPPTPGFAVAATDAMGRPASAIGNRHLFTGRLWHAESGLVPWKQATPHRLRSLDCEAKLHRDHQAIGFVVV